MTFRLDNYAFVNTICYYTKLSWCSYHIKWIVEISWLTPGFHQRDDRTGIYRKKIGRNLASVNKVDRGRIGNFSSFIMRLKWRWHMCFIIDQVTPEKGKIELKCVRGVILDLLSRMRLRASLLAWIYLRFLISAYLYFVPVQSLSNVLKCKIADKKTIDIYATLSITKSTRSALVYLA